MEELAGPPYLILYLARFGLHVFIEDHEGVPWTRQTLPGSHHRSWAALGGNRSAPSASLASSVDQSSMILGPVGHLIVPPPCQKGTRRVLLRQQCSSALFSLLWRIQVKTRGNWTWVFVDAWSDSEMEENSGGETKKSRTHLCLTPVTRHQITAQRRKLQ